MCNVLQVAPSTYYATRSRKPSARHLSDKRLKTGIARVYRDNFRVYGIEKVWRQLNREGQPAAVAEPLDASNPNPVNPALPPVFNFHKADYCETAGDLDHSWNGTHNEFDGGKMDGFTAANANSSDPTGSRTMGWYDQQDLPFYYALYNAFAIGDHYFSSVLSQTFPNRFYLLAGTSFGHIRNDFPAPDGFTQPTIFNLLDNAGVSWKVYFSEVPFAAEF